MTFDNHALYNGYSAHADHVYFIEQYWLKYVKDFLEIDYAPLG